MSHAVQLVELGLVIFGLGVLAQIANRFAFSPIPLYLVAGLAFGQGGLVPLATSHDFIETAAEIGVILLLLSLGLEYTAEELLDGMRRGVWAGIADLVLNFTPGVIAGLLLGWEPVVAIVLGGVTYVSSSGVVAKTMTDWGRLGNKETPTVLTILVLEDLAMAVYLPIVSGMLVGGGVAKVSGSVALAVVSAILTMVLAVRLGPFISRLLRRTTNEVLLLIIVGLALLVGGYAEALNVSAGVGAFLVGIALSGPTASGAHDLLTPLRDLFAAVFFVFFGFQTDPADLPSMFLVAAALAAVTGATKYYTGWWSAKRAGVDAQGCFRAGAALVARGEFSIVIAGLAVAAGLEEQLAPLATAYVLILAIAGPLMMRFEQMPLRRLSTQKF